MSPLGPQFAGVFPMRLSRISRMFRDLGDICSVILGTSPDFTFHDAIGKLADDAFRLFGDGGRCTFPDFTFHDAIGKLADDGFRLFGDGGRGIFEIFFRSFFFEENFGGGLGRWQKAAGGQGRDRTRVSGFSRDPITTIGDRPKRLVSLNLI